MTVSINASPDGTYGELRVNGNPSFRFGADTSGQLNDFRNRIINGLMRIDQRNNGGAIVVSSGVNAFPVDRFFMIHNTTVGMQVQQGGGPDPSYNSFVTSITSAASAGAAQLATIQHRIEGFNSADFAFGTSTATSVTLSFWVRSSVTGTFCVSLRNNNSDRAYVAEYTINLANTFELKRVTIPGDVTGTWAPTTATGIIVAWDLGSGTNFNATANTWVGTNSTRTANQINFINSPAATFFLSGVQLEKGSIATDIERRSYGVELMLCRRYGTPLPANLIGQCYTVATGACLSYLDTPMRTTSPTLSTSVGFTVTLATGGTSACTVAAPSLISNELVITFSGAAGLVAGNATTMQPPAGTFLSAEL